LLSIFAPSIKTYGVPPETSPTLLLTIQTPYHKAGNRLKRRPDQTRISFCLNDIADARSTLIPSTCFTTLPVSPAIGIPCPLIRVPFSRTDEYQC
jgi:hypothetical protein